MFCINCGAELPDGTQFCTSCGTKLETAGTAVANEEKACPKCGAALGNGDLFCTSCGVQIGGNSSDVSAFLPEKKKNAKGQSQKSWIAALLLCIFLGVMSIHRFYAGRIITAIIWLALWVLAFIIVDSNETFAGLIAIAISVWWIIDLILIVAGKFKDKKGLVIKRVK